MKKVILGDSKPRVCRFCGRSEPEVSFRHDAHAIPEALGNRSIFTNYECDCCNHFFGRGIETDLGNWTKPSRTLSRISGKRGVPTLKGCPNRGWRIEYHPNRFCFEHYENDPHFVVDQKKKQIMFELQRDAYMPVAVLKAFVKIGLTFVRPEEVPNFSETLAWIRDPDHSKAFLNECPVLWTYQPGPMPHNLIVAILLRRKPLIADVPYAFLVLAYGNDMFQVVLPSPKQDSTVAGRKLRIPPLRTPNGPDPRRYGKARVKRLDLCGRSVVRGERIPVALGFDHMVVQNCDRLALKKP